MPRTIKKLYKNKKGGKRSKSKTLKKKQKGGGLIVPLIVTAGSVAAFSAAALAAFTSFKYSEMIKEKTRIKVLLSQVGDIGYLPKIFLTKSETDIEHYLQCVSNIEFIELLRKKNKLLKSITLQNILTTSTDIDPSLVEMKKFLKKHDPNFESESDKSYLNVGFLESSLDDPELDELKLYLLATATKTKSAGIEIEEESKLASKNINWINLIYEGGTNFDSTFDSEVEELLRSRGSDIFITSEIKDKLKGLKGNHYLNESINRKMESCTNNPRDFESYIRNEITWDSNKQCLACPDQGCLIYIYDYYYSFLKQKSTIDMLNKLYILALAEARVCVLSKCIVLEALRQESGDKTKVKEILEKIHKRDEERLKISSVVPEKYGELLSDKKPSKEQTDNPDLVQSTELTEKQPITELTEKQPITELMTPPELKTKDVSPELSSDSIFGSSEELGNVNPKKQVGGLLETSETNTSQAQQEGVQEPVEKQPLQGNIPQFRGNPSFYPQVAPQFAPPFIPSNPYPNFIPMATVPNYNMSVPVPMSFQNVPKENQSFVGMNSSSEPGKLLKPNISDNTINVDGESKQNEQEKIGIQETNKKPITEQATEQSTEQSTEQETEQSNEQETEQATEQSTEQDTDPKKEILGENEEETMVEDVDETESFKPNDEFVSDLSVDLDTYLVLLNNQRDRIVVLFQQMIDNTMEFESIYQKYFDKRLLTPIITRENLKNNMKAMFPLIEKVMVPLTDYNDNKSLTGTFNMFFKLFSNYPDLFLFISPWFLGKYCFNLTEDRKSYDYDMDKMVFDVSKLSDRNTVIPKMLAISFMNSRRQLVLTKDTEPYSKLNKINLTYLLGDMNLLTKVIKELSFIYSITGHVELTKLVRELIVSGSHNDIVNLFRQNKLFMAKLSENKELLSKMTKKELMDKFVDMRSSGVPNKKLNTPGKMTCKKETSEIMDKINKNEPFSFNKNQALLLEFCTKAMDNLNDLMNE